MKYIKLFEKFDRNKFYSIMKSVFSIMHDYVSSGSVSINGEKIYVSEGYNEYEPFNYVEYNIPLYKIFVSGGFDKDDDITDEFKSLVNEFIYEYYNETGYKLHPLSIGRHHRSDRTYCVYFIQYDHRHHWEYYSEVYEMLNNFIYDSDLYRTYGITDGVEIGHGTNNFDIYDDEGRRFEISLPIFSNINKDGSFKIKIPFKEIEVVTGEDIDYIENIVISHLKSYFKTEMRDNMEKFKSTLDELLVDYTISSTENKKDHILLKLEVSNDFDDKFYDVKITNDKLYIGDKEFTYDDLKNELWEFFY